MVARRVDLRRRRRRLVILASAASLLGTVAFLPTGALGAEAEVDPPRECPPPPSPAAGESCVKVEQYEDFEEGVAAADEVAADAKKGAPPVVVTFCPFVVAVVPKSPSARIFGNVHVRCQTRGACMLRGGSGYVKITGSHARATVQGFIFQGARIAAVEVMERADGHEQAICDCDFVGNTDRAIKLEEGTRTLIARSTFVDNKSDESGGGIDNYGTARVDECTFEKNEAELGGAIMSTEDAYLELSNSIFINNVASIRGSAVFLEEGGDGRFKEGGGNLGLQATARVRSDAEEGGSSGGEDCNGIYDDDTKTCAEFDLYFPVTPTFVPTATPTFNPTASPSDVPSSTPTVSLAPSGTPTSEPSAPPTVSFEPSSAPSSSPTPAPTVSQQPSAQPSSKPSAAPTASPTSTPSSPPTFHSWTSNPVPDDPPPGYYNYDPTDKKYGPSAWGDIDDDDVSHLDEYKYWKQFELLLGNQLHKGGIQHNYCDVKAYRDNAAPIDLNVGDLNFVCHEYHMLRRKAGKLPLTDPLVEMDILRNKLRMRWPNDLEAKGPSADIPKGWGHHYPVIHADVLLRSAHTLDGKEYPGELQIAFMTTKGRGVPIFSVFMDYDPDDKDNWYFQTAIHEWERKFQQDRAACQSRQLMAEEGVNETLRSAAIDDVGSKGDANAGRFQNLRGEQSEHEEGRRRLNPVFDIFHPSIFVTEWWYGYEGATMDPPCYPIAEYRILDEPMHLSRRQMRQLENILFTHVDPVTCALTSNHYDGKTSRPVMPAEGRDLHRCSCIDYNVDTLRLDQKMANCKKDPLHPWYKRECPDWWGGECPEWYYT